MTQQNIFLREKKFTDANKKQETPNSKKDGLLKSQKASEGIGEINH